MKYNLMYLLQCLKELYPWLCIVVETKKPSKHGGDNQSTGSTKTEASATTQAWSFRYFSLWKLSIVGLGPAHLEQEKTTTLNTEEFRQIIVAYIK